MRKFLYSDFAIESSGQPALRGGPKKLRGFLYSSIVALTAISSAVSGAEWGDLTMKFVYDAAPPAPKALVITKDPEFCGKHKLNDEQLVVNPTNNGIANVVVSLYVARGSKPPKPHESYEETAKASVTLDNKDCRFEPRVLALRTTQTLLVGNSDPVGHNTNITCLRNQSQNVLVPSGGNLKVNFTTEETVPSPVACNIHPWMKAYVIIKDHPYVGISDKDGVVTIKNLPAGKLSFQMWQEASGYVASGKLNGKPAKWERGRIEVTIKPGQNDVGEIKVAPSLFKLN